MSDSLPHEHPKGASEGATEEVNAAQVTSEARDVQSGAQEIELPPKEGETQVVNDPSVHETSKEIAQSPKVLESQQTDPKEEVTKGDAKEQEEEDYPQQSEEDLRRVLDQAREQGRKLTDTKRQDTPEEIQEREETRRREAARKEKVLARLATKGAITFADLFDLGLGKAAAGCHLRCEVLRRVMEHWPNSKQVRVMDSAGDARSVFFYTDENPYYDLEEIREGNVFTFKEPYLHYFMDGQTGLRVENAKLVTLETNQEWKPTRRLDYALAEKAEGSRWMKQKKWDEACTRYSYAIEHITGCPTADPEIAAQRLEVEKTLYLNLALALLNKDNYAETIKLCRKALDIDPNLPKAYFRMGQAQAKDRQWEQAEASYLEALKFEPNDKLIKEALRSLRALMRERKESEVQLWKGKIQKEPTKVIESPKEPPSLGNGISNLLFGDSKEASPLPAVSSAAAQGSQPHGRLNYLLLSAGIVAVLSMLVAILYMGVTGK